MSKPDLAARPIYHRLRESHRRAPEHRVRRAGRHPAGSKASTGWSIKKFVTTTRRYRSIEIQAGQHTITAADPIPDDLPKPSTAIHRAAGAH